MTLEMREEVKLKIEMELKTSWENPPETLRRGENRIKIAEGLEIKIDDVIRFID